MSLFSNLTMLPTKVLASASIFSKLLSGAGGFIVTGYFVSPDSLGRLSVYFAYASLMWLVSDYGLHNPAFRAISIDKTNAVKLFNEYTLFRILLSFPVFVAGTFLLIITGALKYSDIPFFLCLSIATYFNAHADFIQIYFRGVGKYSVEASISVLTGFIHLALVAIVAEKYRNIEIIALAILFSRTFYWFISLLWARHYVPIFYWSAKEIRAGVGTFYFNIRKLRHYAADSIATASFSHIDILMVNHFFGLHLSGVYQIGSKVSQISLAMVQVFASTYVPIISRNLHGAEKNENAASNNIRRATFELLSVGIIFSAALIFFLPHVVHSIFGEKYLEANVLFVGFGIAVVGRCVAAPFGITLIALDKPRVRTIGQVFVTTVYVFLAILIFPKFGFSHVALVIAASLWAAAFFYVICTFIVAPSLIKNAFLVRPKFK